MAYGPEEQAAYQRRHRAKKRAHYFCQRARRNALEKGLEFDLTPDDIVIPTHCPVLGIELNSTMERRGDNSASLDRIDNHKGYVRGNVMVISWRANKLKGDASVAELMAMAKFYGKALKARCRMS